MIKLIKLFLDAKAKSEAAYAAFLSTSASAILFGTIGLLMLRYFQHRNDRDYYELDSVFEKQRDGIEAALIEGGIITRAGIDEHGLLVALQKALDAKKGGVVA